MLTLIPLASTQRFETVLVWSLAVIATLAVVRLTLKIALAGELAAIASFTWSTALVTWSEAVIASAVALGETVVTAVFT